MLLVVPGDVIASHKGGKNDSGAVKLALTLPLWGIKDGGERVQMLSEMQDTVS